MTTMIRLGQSGWDPKLIVVAAVTLATRWGFLLTSFVPLSDRLRQFIGAMSGTVLVALRLRWPCNAMAAPRRRWANGFCDVCAEEAPAGGRCRHCCVCAFQANLSLQWGRNLLRQTGTLELGPTQRLGRTRVARQREIFRAVAALSERFCGDFATSRTWSSTR